MMVVVAADGWERAGWKKRAIGEPKRKKKQGKPQQSGRFLTTCKKKKKQKTPLGVGWLQEAASQPAGRPGGGSGGRHGGLGLPRAGKKEAELVPDPRAPAAGQLRLARLLLPSGAPTEARPEDVLSRLLP